MEPWLIAIIITIAGTGSGVGLTIFIANTIVNTTRAEMFKQFDAQVKLLSDKFDEERKMLQASFNVLATSNNAVSVRFDEKLDDIRNSVALIASVEKESALLKEWFLRHDEDNKRAFDRVRDQIERKAG